MPGHSNEQFCEKNAFIAVAVHQHKHHANWHIATESWKHAKNRFQTANIHCTFSSDKHWSCLGLAVASTDDFSYSSKASQEL